MFEVTDLCEVKYISIAINGGTIWPLSQDVHTKTLFFGWQFHIRKPAWSKIPVVYAGMHNPRVMEGEKFCSIILVALFKIQYTKFT